MSAQPVTEVQPHDDVVLLVVRKRILDEATTLKLVDEVQVAAAATPGLPIVLDLSRVKFAPSVALGSLVQLSKSFKLDSRRIAVIGVDPRVRESIRVTRLDSVLEIHASLERVIGSSPT